MIATNSSWWRWVKQHALIIAMAPLMLLLALTVVGYLLQWDWTGVTSSTSPPHPQNTDFQRAKTLWDWLQLLIAPAVVALAGLWFTQAQQRREQRLTDQQHTRDQELAQHQNDRDQALAERRANTDRELALDNQREAELHGYFDTIAELLLHENLRGAKPDAEVWKIARARTLTVLHRLDSIRTGSLIRFLSETGYLNLVQHDLKGIDLQGADLRQLNVRGIDLSQANLSHADLSMANVQQAMLDQANLSGADLGAAQLNGAVLTKANLAQADLSWANLDSIDWRVNPEGTVITDLSEANLRGANLSKAHLVGVDLRHADLSGADLSYADLREATLLEANVRGANLKEASLAKANLTKADFSDANLERASLQGATLEGTKITEEQKAKAVPINPFVGY